MPQSSAKKILPVLREKRTERYWELLNNVIDPELGVGIVDIGLIYHVDITDGVATVTMTFTSPGCPAGPELMRRVENEMGRYPGVKDVKITIVWSPLWGADLMNPDIRELLFGSE